MNNIKLLLCIALGALAVSCTQDLEESPRMEVPAYAKKVLNTSDNAVSGELIIYVDEATMAQIDKAGSVTRSGNSELDAIAEQLGAESVEHVFNMQLNPARLRRTGLDRWFVVRFGEDTDLEAAALKLASVDAIERVQFSNKVERPKHSKSVEVDPTTIVATRSTTAKFNDPMYDLQWHYRNTGNTQIFHTAKEGADINVEPAWELTTGRPEVIVAVVDEGVDFTHEDIAPNMWVNEAELNGVEGVDDDGNGYKDDIHGHNFVTNGSVTCSRPGDSGHGTHVAGTVAAVNNNGIGVCGIAGGDGSGNGVRIMTCQIFSNKESAGTMATARAIQYATEMGACILQCSWGFGAKAVGLANDNNFMSSGQYQVEYEAIQQFIYNDEPNCAALDGGIAIFAAGNDSAAEAGYPGAFNEYIAVTGFAPDGLPAWYTNYNRGCNIAAPGGEMIVSSERGGILSLQRKDKYEYNNGTSMACPHVSGVAALALSYALDLGKTFTVQQMKSILLTSVNDIDSSLTGIREALVNPVQTMNLNNYRGKMGTGMIDAYRVLMGVRGTTCIPVAVGEEMEINLGSYLGDGSLNLKIPKDSEDQISLMIEDDVREKLGIETAEIVDNKLYIKCTQSGSGMIKVAFIAGGLSQGGGLSIGGMRIEKEFAIIARPSNYGGGWL